MTVIVVRLLFRLVDREESVLGAAVDASINTQSGIRQRNRI